MEQVQGRMAEEFKTMSVDNFLEKYGCKLMQKKIGRYLEGGGECQKKVRGVVFFN